MNKKDEDSGKKNNLPEVRIVSQTGEQSKKEDVDTKSIKSNEDSVKIMKRDETDYSDIGKFYGDEKREESPRILSPSDNQKSFSEIGANIVKQDDKKQTSTHREAEGRRSFRPFPQKTLKLPNFIDLFFYFCDYQFFCK